VGGGWFGVRIFAHGGFYWRLTAPTDYQASRAAASSRHRHRFVLELRHKIELHNLTGRVVECPLDEMNRPRASAGPQLRVPPVEAEVEQLFAGWREELSACRKFAPAARNYAVARLAADVGLRINEARMLDLDDVRWELGRFGKLNIRHGKGSRRRGPKPRLVPLINGADQNLRWFIEDVWGQLGADHTLPGAPLFPSERKNTDGSCARASAEVFRHSLAQAAARNLPAWAGRLTPHVLRHYCASSSTWPGWICLPSRNCSAMPGPVPLPGTSTCTAVMSKMPGLPGSSARPADGRDWPDEVEPAAGGG
jgi:integrase